MAAYEIHNRCNFVKLFSPSFPHILEKIFFSLDYESYKNCLEVNSEWKGILTSERHKTKGRSVFKNEIVEDERKLLGAARHGKRDEARMLLASGMIDVNCKETVQRTCFDYEAEVLIGADLNVHSNYRGWTPLHIAVRHGHEEVVRFLIDRGAGVNLADEYGGTHLHLAADNGHTEVTHSL